MKLFKDSQTSASQRSTSNSLCKKPYNSRATVPTNSDNQPQVGVL